MLNCTTVDSIVYTLNYRIGNNSPYSVSPNVAVIILKLITYNHVILPQVLRVHTAYLLTE